MPKTAGAILSDIYDAWRSQDLEWLASYLPEDFHHVVHVPATLHPLGGERAGKAAALERLRLVAAEYEILHYDTANLMVERNRAAVEIPMHYRHRRHGTILRTTKANFWTLEDGWPVRLSEYYDVSELQSFFRMSPPQAD